MEWKKKLGVDDAFCFEFLVFGIFWGYLSKAYQQLTNCILETDPEGEIKAEIIRVDQIT